MIDTLVDDDAEALDYFNLDKTLISVKVNFSL
jgi:hypothetical protein